MKRSVYIFLSLAILLASCGGIKKFDYATAYNFKRVSFQTDPRSGQSHSSASPQNELRFENISADAKISSNRMFDHQTTFKPVTKIERVEISPVEKIIAGMPADLSKREMKKHIRQELKELKQNNPEKLSPKKKPAKVAASQISGNLRTGLILGGVGIILLILGGANGVLAAVGTILILAGVVFVLLDLL